MTNELHQRQMAELEEGLERGRPADLVTALLLTLAISAGIGFFLYLPSARTTLRAAGEPQPLLGLIGFVLSFPIVALPLHRWLRRRRGKRLYSG
jgi:hypothetical protein